MVFYMRESPAAKFASQGDAHVRTKVQIKFLQYPVIKLSELSNHFFLAPDIIAKLHLSLFPLLRLLPLWFKSIHYCSDQFKFCCTKANAIQSHCYN